MPVDFTGAMIAFAFWFIGSIWATKRIRQKSTAPDARFFGSLSASIAFAVAAVLIALLYDFVMVGW